MGGDSSSRSKKRLESSSSPSASSDSESQVRRKSRHRHRSEGHRIRSSRHGSRRRDSESRERSKKRKSRKDDRKEKRKREHRRRSRRENKGDDSDSDVSRLSDSVDEDDDDGPEPNRRNPESVVRDILKRFPGAAGDLKQLLEIIDGGQAVDTRGMSDKSLVKILKKLFMSLNLKQEDSGVYLLSPTAHPTLEIVGPVIYSHLRPTENQSPLSGSPKGIPPVPSEEECRKATEEADGGQSIRPDVGDDSSASSKKRFIGPAMPSAELLAAAARLTEADTALREAELEVDTDLFIGPPPPAVVAEAASSNEAERFEEVTRIVGVEVDSPYDVLGVNHKMSIDNIKKRYWKLSLMVHPDKCSHPQAQQAFVTLNKAFKELQDPEKRKATDDKIRQKEEQEEFMAELKVRREAAQWRRLQGLSMPGDEELLAEVDTKLPRKREEWMTTLPPERKPGMSMHSTTFSRTTKEGRGDTSVWTDNPLDKAQKAKMSYLEAYNEAAALAAADEEKKRPSDADLVDKYNSAKRSKSLMQKHLDNENSSRSKKRSKQSKQAEKEEWEGQHPWKPWDREKDLVAGRQKVNLNSENMAEGLTSRFSSGNIQRNFL